MVSLSRKTLFVGGLSITISEGDLIHYFGEFSKVTKVVFLRNQHTGKPKGYAFVTLKDSQVAKRISQLKHVICGRRVECQLAAHKSEKETNSEERSRRKIFVTNVPPYMPDKVFEQYFSQYGEIHNCYIIKNPDKRTNKSFGFVEFERIEDAEYVLSQRMNIQLEAHNLVVLPFKDMKSYQKNQYDNYSRSISFKFQDNQGHYGNWYQPDNSKCDLTSQLMESQHVRKIPRKEETQFKNTKFRAGKFNHSSANLHFRVSTKHMIASGGQIRERKVVSFNREVSSHQFWPLHEASCIVCKTCFNHNYAFDKGLTVLEHRGCLCSTTNSSTELHKKIFNAPHKGISCLVGIQQVGSEKQAAQEGIPSF